MIRNLATVKPMNDSDIAQLGVRVLDTLCADIAPPPPATEEENDSLTIGDREPIEDHSGSPTDTGCENRVEDIPKPKREWKRKIYPASAVRRSARNRMTKKNYDEL